MRITAYDKRLHLIAGFLVALATTAVLTPATGMLTAMAAGALKEFYDWLDYGKVDWKDMAYTWGGGALGAMVAEAMKWMF